MAGSDHGLHREDFLCVIFTLLKDTVGGPRMDEFQGMKKRCSDCEGLLRNGRDQPHEYLMIVQKTPGERLYRCLLCDTRLAYSETGPEAWKVTEDSENPRPVGMQASAPRTHYPS